MTTTVNAILKKQELLCKTIRDILKESDVETLTERLLRRQLEEHFQLPDKSLDVADAKLTIKELLKQEYAAILSQAPADVAKSKTDKRSKSKSAVASSSKSSTTDKQVEGKKRRSNAIISSESSHAETESSEELIDPVKNSVKSLVKKSRKLNTAKSTSKSTTSTKDNIVKTDIEAKKIDTLKKYILKCGVRKQWSKELADCKTGKEQIRRLQSILEELGIKGRPTLDKCKQVAIKRELKAEQESLNLNAVMETKTRAARRSTHEETTSKAPITDGGHAIDFAAIGDADTDTDTDTE
ncbi:hypothetical protein BDF19DRAFT_499179 [Syncephalis fuscata]|nr:hypothetical protein BDF19DRAFT_499179 [Syncephalis fuscata]